MLRALCGPATCHFPTGSLSARCASIIVVAFPPRAADRVIERRRRHRSRRHAALLYSLLSIYQAFPGGICRFSVKQVKWFKRRLKWTDPAESTR
jgi:hypothetical protein